MNLVEALNAALPDIPAFRPSPVPRVHPRLAWREQTRDGQPLVMAYIPGGDSLYTFNPQQFQLIQRFNGIRTFAEIASEHLKETGEELTETELRDFSANMAEMGFWYEGAQPNITLSAKEKEERSKRSKRRSKFGDLSCIYLYKWDPDRYLTALARYTKWIYTPWFTLFTLAAFAWMAAIFVIHWNVIGRDTLLYYTFTQKSGADLLEFWLLFFGLAFIHESAHGLTCKQFGGGVHRMGAVLIYLTGAFYVDVTEVCVYGSKFQRIATVLAGIWSELVVCFFATVVWWGTPAGTFTHEFAYKVILITGVAVVLINLNPLIKLDGYYLFTEIIGIDDLKELSTAYMSGLVRRKIFRLPVEIPPVGRRARWLYPIYAIVSGLYSYLLLFAVCRLLYNVLRAYSPEWAFVPALAMTVMIFRSRIRKLLTFIQVLYLDKKERVMATLRKPAWAVAAILALLMFVFVPLRRDSADGTFVLEAGERAILRAEQPGRVLAVYGTEGARIERSALVVELENLDLDSAADRAHANARRANSLLTDAQLRYDELGPRMAEDESAKRTTALANERRSKIHLRSPIAGVLSTPRLADRVGQFVTKGTELAEVDDSRTMRAWVNVADPDMRHVQADARVTLSPNGGFHRYEGRVLRSALAAEANTGPSSKFRGMGEPSLYRVEVVVDNPDGRLLAGMTGSARIYSQRRSIAAMLARELREFVERKLY
jgi:putative peptide zinc metalloprotease protein